MDIFLIRHTKTAAINGLCYGQTDVALADTFIEETQAVVNKLASLSNGCLIYSSPLSRCLRLAETFRRPVVVDQRLREVNFGDWEGIRFDEIDQQTLRHWTEHFVTQPPPNGECFNDLCQRVGVFWDELIAAQPAKQVILITHAGVIRALLAHVLQLPPRNAFSMQVDAGSVHKLRYQNDYTYIDYINR
ncbi:MAG: alpha-ribazole phosphatase [Gammaproteobacteria bacterium]|nr:alpha-ribazole phosphatase [Gammaproteobacteria bacterium]